AAPAAARAPIRLGANLWRGVKAFLITAAVTFAAILAADVGVEKYQAMRVRERAARVAALQHLALNRLRGDVQSVADLGDGPADDSAMGVTKIEGKQAYRYRFDARVRDFAQLLPNYMHVRFSGTMLVSPSSTPNGDVFERKDNYYVYLKPFDVPDEVVLRRMRFFRKTAGMDPHAAALRCRWICRSAADDLDRRATLLCNRSQS